MKYINLFKKKDLLETFITLKYFFKTLESMAVDFGKIIFSKSTSLKMVRSFLFLKVCVPPPSKPQFLTNDTFG